MRRAREPSYTFWSMPIVLGMAKERGVDLDPLLALHGLDKSQAGHPISTPIDTLERFFADAARALNEPSLGWQVGLRVPRGAYGAVEFCCRTRPNLEGFFVVMRRFLLVVNPLMQNDFVRQDGVGRFRQWTPGRERVFGPHLNEFGLSVILAKAEDALGAPVDAREVSFAHDRATSQQVVDALGGRVRFGADSNGILFDEPALARPLRLHDAEMTVFLEKQCEEALAAVKTPMAHKVVAAMQAELGVELTLVAIAAKLDIAPRSLQYELKRENTTFDELVDDYRSNMGKRLIRAGRPVTEVAYLLGYSGARAFDRAFLRWTGASPTEWRARGAE